MSLSFKSDTYNNVISELSAIKAGKGKITSDDLSAVAKSLEIEVGDIKEAAKDYKQALADANTMADSLQANAKQRQQIIDTYTKERTLGAQPLQKMFREGVGATADAVGFLGEAFLPEETVDRISQAYKHTVPKSLRKDIQLFLDPVSSDIDKIGGAAMSYALPATGVIKGGKAVAQSSPYLLNWFHQLGTKAKLATKAGSYGVGYAAGATIIEDPRDNVFDYVSAEIFNNPEAKQRLEDLAKNPKDVEAKDYLDAFVRNLAIEGIGGAGIHSAGSLISGIARSYRSGGLAPVRNAVTQIGDTTRGAARPYIAPIALKTKPVRRKFAQLFSSRMGTDDNFLQALLRRETIDEQSVIKADGYASELQAELDKLPQQFQTDEFYEQVINPALQGNQDSILLLQQQFPDLLQKISNMRNALDDLSSQLPVGAGELRTIIDNNKGVYINRTYKLFDDPTFKKELGKKLKTRPENLRKIREINQQVARGEISAQEGNALKNNLTDDVIERAAQTIANQRGIAINNPEVQETLEQIARIEDKETFTDFMESLAKKSRYSTSSKPLKKRQDIDVTIRDFMGEVKDPKKNFINTYVKLGNLNAQYKFLEEIAGQMSVRFQNRIRQIRQDNPNLTQDEAIAQAKEGLEDVSKEISADKRLEWIFNGANQGQIVNPLQNVYADKAYIDAIKNGFDVTLNDIKDSWLKTSLQTLAGIKGTTQYAKTVANVPTHGKNMLGNVVMLTANGILPTGTSVKQAVKTTANQLRNKNNRELADQLAEYVELGVTNSGVGLGIVRRNLNEAFKNSDKYLDKILGARKLKEAGKKAADVYQAEDDFFKIIHFERTKDYLKKVYPNLDDNTIKQMAAQRTRDLMPNYRLVPKFFKGLGYSPVGDFVAFPAEMIRITKNLGTYTLKDAKEAALRQSDENFNRAAMLNTVGLRLAGMTVAGSFGDVAQETTKAMFGIGDEQDRALTYLDAPYRINQDKIYLGPIEKDKKTDHVVVPTFYLGSYDPFSIVKVGAKSLHEQLLNGEELTDTEKNRLWGGTLEQTLFPFIGPSMFTETIIDMAQGKQDYDSPEKGFLANSLSKVVDLYDPGYLRYFEKRNNFEKSGLSNNLYSIPEGDVDFPAFLGFRRSTQDLSAGIGRNIMSPISKIQRADRKLKNIFNNPNATQEDIMTEYKNAQKERLEGFKELRGVIQLYKSAGYTLDGLTQDITLAGKKRQLQPSELEILNAANQNYFIASEPKARETFQGPLVPMSDELYNFYSQLNYSRIDK